MKKKTKRIAIKSTPLIRDLAEELFNVGMDGWRAVDKKKSPMKFSEIESPGQIAGWYAIAMHVREEMAAIERAFLK